MLVANRILDFHNRNNAIVREKIGTTAIGWEKQEQWYWLMTVQRVNSVWSGCGISLLRLVTSRFLYFILSYDENERTELIENSTINHAFCDVYKPQQQARAQLYGRQISGNISLEITHGQVRHVRSSWQWLDDIQGPAEAYYHVGSHPCENKLTHTQCMVYSCLIY